MSAIHYSSFDTKTPVGTIVLGVTECGIAVLSFERNGFTAKRNVPLRKLEWIESEQHTRPYTKQLQEYFSGSRKNFDLPLDLQGSEFQMRCWQALLRIPYGETRSYADVAQEIGHPQAYRAVGNANNRNPVAIIVPCHRVLAAQGKLGGYGGGLSMKEWLLNLEGASYGAQAKSENLFG